MHAIPTLIGPEAERFDLTSSCWDFSKQLKVGISYFPRLVANSAAILSADVISLLVAFGAAAALRWAILGRPMNPEWVCCFIAVWVLATAAWGLLPGWGLSVVESLRRQVLLIFLTFSGAIVVLFLSKSSSDYSRATILLAFLIALPTIPSLRSIAKRSMIQRRLWGIPVAVYGGGRAGGYLIQRLKDEPGHGYNPVCVFDDNPDLMNQRIHGVPVVGRTDSFAPDIPAAILAMTKIDSNRISELMEGPLSNYLRVVLIPNLVHTRSLWATSRDLSGIPGLEMSNNLLDPGKQILKRCLDVGLTIATLPFWGPLCACIAGVIWLADRKSPIFKQRRIGEGGKEFDVWKFRTMVPDAESVLCDYLEKNPQLRHEWEQHCKLRNDPRITRIGWLLRRTSLDEIPQLINVLRGEMALVGPRPLPTYHYDQLTASVRRLRKRVKPGITGLWQVSGRSDAGTEGMALWDPYYVRNWSLWLDIIVLVRTLRVVLRGIGAR